MPVEVLATWRYIDSNDNGDLLIPNYKTFKYENSKRYPARPPLHTPLRA